MNKKKQPNLIHEILQNISLTIPNQDAKNSLIGTCLINFGTGGMLMWGQISIYILSYLKHYNPDISLSQQNFIIDLALIPILLGMLFSYVLAKKIGFILLIRICCLLYPLGVIMASFSQNFYIFASFYIILSCTSYAMLTVPLLNCLWSNFPKKDSGKLAGISFFFHGAAQLLYSLLALYLINPDNVPANIEYSEGGQIVLMFPIEIAGKIPQSLIILGVIYSLFCISGSYLVNKKNSSQEPLLQYTHDDSPIEQGNNAKKGEIIITENSKTQNINNDNINNNNSEDGREISTSEFASINMISSNNDQTHKISDNREALLKDNQKQKKLQKQQKQDDAITDINSFYRLKEQAEIEEFQKTLNFKTSVRSLPFIIIFICTFILSMYGTFLLLNYKIYGITKINDDSFLTYIQDLTILVATLSNLVWGPLADRASFKELYCSTIACYAFFAATLPYAFDYRITAAIWLSVIGVIHSGIYAITGPALIHYFGVEIASQLLPVKALALYGAGLLMPVFSLIVLKLSSFDSLLFYLGLFCIVGAMMAVFLPKILKKI